jgi:hypothetical protein
MLSFAKIANVSGSKRAKHTKAKYFFICHYYNSQELDLQYCPTELMWADILTKPVQGAKCCLVRAFLMNCPVDYCEEPPFIPFPHPTLALTNKILQPKSVSLSLPSLNKSFAPMKPQVSLTAPSSWGCVGTKGEKPTDTPTEVPTPHKKVSWWDALFPCMPLADVYS